MTIAQFTAVILAITANTISLHTLLYLRSLTRVYLYHYEVSFALQSNSQLSESLYPILFKVVHDAALSLPTYWRAKNR